MSSHDGAAPPAAVAGTDARELMARRIHNVLAIDPDAIALSFEEATFTWSFFADAIADLDAQLAAYPQARRIGVILRNRPGQFCAVLAVIASGRSLVTLSPHLGDVGLAEDIQALAPDVIIADDEDWARPPVLSAAESVGAVALRTGSDRGVAAHAVSWAPSPAGEAPGDLAVLMMTSGTTGKPKRIELTYPKMLAAFRAAGTPVDDSAPLQLHPRASILWASLAHIGGLYFVIAHALEGRSVALLEKFEVDAWAELVRRHQPGFIRLPPSALRMVVNADLPRDTFDGVRAVGSGTAPLPAELADEFEQRYGIPVLRNYGATEFAGAIAGWSLADKREWGDRKKASVGRAHHGIELRVVDRDTRAVLPVGEVGLLEARGGQLPDVEGGWVRTTDLASVDTDGFLFIHGRADDAINRGGFKIPPSVIEDALDEHPAVNEASAVALPDERLGEVPVVAVTVKSPVTEAELLDYLRGKLTGYQRPVALKIVEALPRTPSMKVDRVAVRDQFFALDAPIEGTR